MNGTKIQVLGVATTEFGELWKKSPRALAKQAMKGALDDAKLKAEQVDAIVVGNMLAGILGNQANLGPLFAEELGVPVPSIRVEGACASGGLALNTAVNSILAGQYKTVLALGVEKMTDSGQDEVTTGLMAAGSDNERMAGATFPGIYALMAQAYMDEYGISEETLASISVKNHYHGSLNEKAQFRKVVTIEEVMNSGRIADPLKLLDCSPISDGASAVIISSETRKSKPVYITASEVGTDTLSLHDRASFVSLGSAVSASQRAYKKAKIKPTDVNVAEIHDCFSIAEAIAVEDLGFSKRGEGAIDISYGKMTIGKGNLITNPSGGLKACGHPVGATGIKQVVEITQQLRGEAGSRQVKNAKIGLTHNVGGSGAVAVVHVFQNNI
jgi:acetyl-CoA C-acetyltransferase